MPSFLSRLFGRSSSTPAAAQQPVLHKDCRIFPDPIREAGGFRVAARIEKDANGETLIHHLSRADTFADREQAVATSVEKAKLAIDQLGDQLFR